MKNHITHQEWELFVNDGHLGARQGEIFSSIAFRMAQGESTLQDRAIYLYHSSSIEELLKSL